MRQASWEELFRAGEAPATPRRPSIWSRLAVFSWEELVTLLVVMVAFVTVVQSIDSAHWVAEMPSLYPVAFLGLLLGLGLSRTKLPEVVAHLIALSVGVVAVFLTVAGDLDGTVRSRAWDIVDRTHDWLNAAFTGGISNDNLPFILMVVALTFLLAYIAAWAIFRWYNAWLGIIPGGLALLTNISYLPGQKSFALLVYLFCAILLLARVSLLRHARVWRAEGTRYPDLISLHVLNVTVWMALALLALAWLLPISGGGPFGAVWDAMVSPISGPVSSLNRVFISVNARKGGSIHSFGSTLPLVGSINLGGGDALKVTAAEPGYLRAQSYDVYTPEGWKIGGTSQATVGAWPALKALTSPEEVRKELRRPVTIQVTTDKKSSVLFSEGQPLDVNIESRVVFGPDPADVTSIRPLSQINEGTQYKVDGTESNASVGRLQGATGPYPAWTATYLQLPPELPRRVIGKAREVTAGADNPYDKAAALEQYLRTFAVDTNIPAPPPKRDSVDYFLFTLGRGYFDYHASAMVVMLRSLGVPARLAVGYTMRPQDRVPDSDVYNVSEANAFAWPEVYFPNLGWVEFNPTPSEPRIARNGTDDATFSDTSSDDFQDDTDIPDDVAPPTTPAPPTVDQLQVTQSSHIVSRIILGVIVALMALTALVAVVFNYSWQRGLGGFDYPVQLWEKTLRLARWSSVKPLPQETPRDLVARLRREVPETDEGLDYMGETYLRVRFGHKELSAEDREKLTTVWRKTRNTLLRNIFRRDRSKKKKR